MLKKTILVAAIGCFLGSLPMGAVDINIIPKPQQVVTGDGNFCLTEQTKLYSAGEGAAEVAAQFAEKVEKASGFVLPKGKKAGKGTIAFVIDSKVAGKEAYTLTVTKDGVTCAASTANGLFYAMQSLLQLLPPDVESTALAGKVTGWKVPVVAIEDAPRFSYRGVHIDPSRHFQSVETVKRQLDVMASYKFNKMHWHITDDQGWRIEIKKYPKLTEVGARRVEADGSITEGFYTQEQIRDIVEYARQRHIEVIPELEIPGHELAAIAAYPELSCRGEATTPRIIWGVEDVVMCPGKEKMFGFLEDIIDEMVELFPCKLFHIGGDESPRGEWAACPDCQKLISKLGYKDEPKRPKEAQLQSYIVGRVGKYLAEKDRRLIGWDEILEGGNLDTTAIVMSWRGEEGGIIAARAGHPVLMTPASHALYLDHYQDDPLFEATSNCCSAPMERIYDYDPVPEEVRESGKGHLVLGVQANSWSEYILTPAILENRLYPRTLALSEIAWTAPEKKDYKDFCRRLDGDASLRLQARGINFYIPQPAQPGGSFNPVVFTGKSTTLELTAPRSLEIVYTTDYTTPTASSPRYTGPIELNTSATVRTAVVLPCGIVGPVRTIDVKKSAYLPALAKKEDVKPGLELRIFRGKYQQPADIPATPDVKDSIVAEIEVVRNLTKVPNNVRNVEDYAAEVEGYFEVPADGVYEITSNNNRVWIDGALLIDNAALPIPKVTKTNGQMALAKGLHKIKVLFIGGIFNGWPTYWDDAFVKMRTPRGEWKEISKEQLFH